VYFEIQHETRYTFDAPVRLGRHTLRLRPMSDADQHVHRFEMTVTPRPAGSNELSDLDGNYATAVQFEGETRELVIETSSVVETRRSNPFDYVWQGPRTLPLKYSPAFSEALGPFRASLVPEPVRQLGLEVSQEAGGDAQAFPLQLAQLMRRRFRRVGGVQDALQEAPETLARGEGSPRDLAVLFMAASRSQGYAARFVSGYSALPGDNKSIDLHAWAEVFLPGAGWRGFDPTLGVAVADRHVAIAVGALAEQTAPISGTHDGPSAGRLETTVRISEIAPLV
jgi:transglutaminase-like putative cysteine protease